MAQAYTPTLHYAHGQCYHLPEHNPAASAISHVKTEPNHRTLTTHRLKSASTQNCSSGTKAVLKVEFQLCLCTDKLGTLNPNKSAMLSHGSYLHQSTHVLGPGLSFRLIRSTAHGLEGNSSPISHNPIKNKGD